MISALVGSQKMENLLNSFLSFQTSLYLVFSLTILIAFYFIRQIVLTRKRYEGILTLPTTWVVGNLLGHMENFTRLGNRAKITVVLGEICIGIGKVVHQMGEGLIYFRVGPFKHIVAAMNAKTAEALLTDQRNITKAREYDFGKGWLGNGLLNANGSHWRAHRKLLNPTFNFSVLQRFIPVMNAQLGTFCEVVESGMNQEGKCVVKDIRPLITNCAIDIICQTAMGMEMNAQKKWLNWIKSSRKTGDKKDSTALAKEAPGQVEYVESFSTFLNIFIGRLIRPWLHPEPIFRLFPAGRRFYESIRRMHQFTNGVIEKRKKELEELIRDQPTVEAAMEFLSGEKAGEKEEVDGAQTRLRFLDLLLVYHLKDPANFDLISVREEVDTFMVAGHDTTASMLQFAFLLLGHNPDKQALMQEELDGIFEEGSESRDITVEDLRRMVYMEMVIKEVLRLYPPATFFARLITDDFACDRFIIPKGTTFLIMSYSIHRDPSVYEKPEHFIPERFAPERGLLRDHPYAFLPFSSGARNCIGQKYAMLELKIFLASVFRRYSVRSVTKQEEVMLNFAIVSRSCTPISIEFRSRK